MGMRQDALCGEATELVADHGEGFVEAGILNGGTAKRIGQVPGGSCHRRGRLAFKYEALDGGVAKQAFGGFQRAHLVGADGLALVHRDAANKLGAIVTEQDLCEEGLDLAELAVGGEALSPMGGFAQGLDIGDDPGEAMGEMLMGVEKLAVRLATGGERGGGSGLGSRAVGFDRGDGLKQGWDQVFENRVVARHYHTVHFKSPIAAARIARV